METVGPLKKVTSTQEGFSFVKEIVQVAESAEDDTTLTELTGPEYETDLEFSGSSKGVSSLTPTNSIQFLQFMYAFIILPLYKCHIYTQAI